MKKLFMMLVFLFVVYFGIQIGFRFTGKGHNSEYKLVDGNNIFYVTENYNKKDNNNPENYYLQIKINDTIFSYSILNEFYAKEAIVDSVKYFKDDVNECIYVKYSGNKVITDVMCKENNIITYYHDMTNTSEALNNFVSSIVNYKKNTWMDNKDNSVNEYPLTIYPNNINDNNYVAIENYKGIYTLNNRNLKKYVNVNLFIKDSYNRQISGIVKDNYIVADYSSSDTFNELKVVNLIDNSVSKITYHSNISFNSYIQGVVDNSMYIFDKDSRKQYEINIKSKTIVEIGNSTDGIKFYNLGEWEKREANDAYLSELYFIISNNDYTNDIYYKIDKIGNNSGYYYLYKKVSDGILVYRTSTYDKDNITYLFKASNIRDIIYLDTYIYFIDGDALKYYSDATGLRTLAVNEELNFNNSLSYYLYIKK